MDSTVSVSKGCFAQKRKKRGVTPSPSVLSGQVWYQSYKKCLTSSEELLEVLEKRVFEEVFGGLMEHIKNYTAMSSTQQEEIPTATLLTGVNMPDHTSLFSTLSHKIVEEVSPYVATLWSRDCPSLKAAVERMCSQLMHVPSTDDMDCNISTDEDDARVDTHKIQRWHCNLQYLSTWFSKLQVKRSPRKKTKSDKISEAKSRVEPVVIIIPDFESFSAKVLQDFVLLIKNYLSRLPFILVLGVATAISAVHRSLPYHVSSCLRMKVFHSQPSIEYLNEVLEKVFFLPNRPFHLGGKTFKLLMDIFLFHDFSVMGFIQGFKYCMTQHFFERNWTILSCMPEELPSTVKNLTKEDIELVRALPSVRKHIEELKSNTEIISWLKNDQFVKEEILKLVTSLHEYVRAFFAALRCLTVLGCSLPGAPLGKHLRSVYTLASTCDIVKSPEMKDVMTLLSFFSSDELESKLIEILPILQEAVENGAYHIEPVVRKVEGFIRKLKTLWPPLSSSPTKALTSPCKTPEKNTRSPIKSPLKSPSKVLMNVMSRSQLKEKLKEMSTQDVRLSPFEKLRSEVLKFLSENLFTAFLASPQTKPLHEVLFFDDIMAVKHHIVGSPRQAILRGLRDPHFYLDCDCCKLEDVGEIAPTLPDVSIVYKLHLESGKLINMFDWLQSFLYIVDRSSADNEDVDPQLQARFTRAVAELQFLGFIKSSNRKTDHVTRLTWC